jgi:hypothetical protein
MQTLRRDGAAENNAPPESPSETPTIAVGDTVRRLSGRPVYEVLSVEGGRARTRLRLPDAYDRNGKPEERWLLDEFPVHQLRRAER